MNSVIIHTLHRRSKFVEKSSEGQGEIQGHDRKEGKMSKMNSSEIQIIIMLLLITFGYLILMIPSYGMSFYASFVDYQNSPKLYAGFHLIMAVGAKAYFTNYAINFYLYVISGQKFRNDLVTLFKRICPWKKDGPSVLSSQANTTMSSESTEF